MPETKKRQRVRAQNIQGKSEGHFGLIRNDLSFRSVNPDFRHFLRRTCACLNTTPLFGEQKKEFNNMQWTTGYWGMASQQLWDAAKHKITSILRTPGCL